jgi:hypothetical protein
MPTVLLSKTGPWLWSTDTPGALSFPQCVSRTAPGSPGPLSFNGSAVLDGTPPCGTPPGPFVTDDDDAVTGDYANSLENKQVSTNFVIVTWSSYIGQGGLLLDNPPRSRRPPEPPTPAPGHGVAVLDRTLRGG